MIIKLFPVTATTGCAGLGTLPEQTAAPFTAAGKFAYGTKLG
jgi:hypothetical protein